MKVLITGATGLVGKAIVKVLHQKGIPINYLTTSKKKLTSTEDFNGFYWDPKKEEIDLDCFEDVQAIINLAGTSIAKRWTPNHRKKVLSSRVNSLRTLKKGLEQSKNKEVECLISASAIGVYPDSKSEYYDENTTQIDDGFLGEVVQRWEVEADSFKKLNIEVAKIRIGLVLSNDGGALPKMSLPIKNFLGAPLGSGEQWQSWIHIADLAQMFVFAVENNLKGVYNGVAPNPVTNTKMTKEVAKFMERPLWLPNIPAFLLKVFLGKMSTLVLASQRVSSKKIEEEGFSFQYVNICQALKDLFTPQEEESIPASVEA
ncbi:TIGR01777 family oxidoreductase [Allomuricauda sp. F6463D]|uniref:TIGR01777 family oxidoreductase n=1 Tax=Allomuricauda sp. F6463D TaxID=2926409 RepID=UPI001FF3A450|nr:TIGR01777 family oxidoreductase [Muricauda sp. F6463D]MCK0160320.1 TIGR01777 family oxidoreductase [Muricauda sp. F6463D]